MREVTVQSFAKINLDLRVLYKRPDQFHELRTVFQTISLADTIRIRVEPARRTKLTLGGNLDIPDNLILRAAEAVLRAARIHAAVHFELDKRIPMGAGLGGGSSNAAAILLALPVLTGAVIPFEKLIKIGTALGSDVPFFLYGGTALGIGRGTELYPLPSVPARPGLLIAPGIHVSTAEAYRDLARTPLTTPTADVDTVTFQSFVSALCDPAAGGDWESLSANDFEGAVFRRHPALLAIKRRLGKSGARPALMTGSGSALFGLFDSRNLVQQAARELAVTLPAGATTVRMTLLTQRAYRNRWRKQLAGHLSPETLWPPQSWYPQP